LRLPRLWILKLGCHAIWCHVIWYLSTKVHCIICQQTVIVQFVPVQHVFIEIFSGIWLPRRLNNALMVGRLDKKQPVRRKGMNERDRRWFHTHRSGYESAWRIMHEERITTHVIFWHLCGSAGPLRVWTRSILRYHQESGSRGRTSGMCTAALVFSDCPPAHPFACLPTNQYILSGVCVALSSFPSETWILSCCL